MKEAIGIVETRGFVAAIEAADAMLKSANVKILDVQIVGSGLVSVTVAGEVAAVAAAVETGKVRAGKIGEIISTNVIASPHDEVDKLFKGE
ncbi:ribonuclease III [Synergistales bacterium]|nr:ribonuclease III [Synergistales bacterium]